MTSYPTAKPALGSYLSFISRVVKRERQAVLARVRRRRVLAHREQQRQQLDTQRTG